MKSILIIGMSTFGQHLLIEFSKRNCEVMIADIDENILTPMVSYAVSAKIADCTNEDVLRSFGVDEFDCCFVCLGGHFTEALEVSYLLKELGARKVISEVNRDIEKKFLLRNGADAVIYPEEDMAVRIAATESNDAVFDVIELSDGYIIYEISVPSAWVGKTIKELRVREKYNINIIAVKKNGHIIPVLAPDNKFSSDEHIIVMCHESDIKKFVK
ncbi:MAG: TrkA family potassium uptake protein [Clostridia bacterium]|nr:TrkA family potassium uptake protein [Clostridia bacterium]